MFSVYFKTNKLIITRVTKNIVTLRAKDYLSKLGDDHLKILDELERTLLFPLNYQSCCCSSKLSTFYAAALLAATSCATWNRSKSPAHSPTSFTINKKIATVTLNSCPTDGEYTAFIPLDDSFAQSSFGQCISYMSKVKKNMGSKL